MPSLRAKKAPASASSDTKAPKPGTANAETQQPASTSSDGAAPDRLAELEKQAEQKQKELKEIEKEIDAEKQRRLEATNKKKRDFTKFMNDSSVSYPSGSTLISHVNVLFENCYKPLGSAWQERRRLYKVLGSALQLLDEQQMDCLPFEQFTQEKINALDELKDFVAQGLAAARRLIDPAPILPIFNRISSMKNKLIDEDFKRFIASGV
ncbi:hypothetical protein NpNSSI1_00011301 [Neofusicoccum parvum]|nr:hypothetical protein NpNSSI1_00011301 [Neofusicoccum parvum]